MQMKERGAETKKRANIHRETVRTRPSTVTIFVGRATRDLLIYVCRVSSISVLVAPASNSLSMISTGLNQYNFLGLPQSVI